MAMVTEPALACESEPANSTAAQQTAEKMSVFLFGSAIFLSAFLLFFVQLLLAKRILPVFGGAPSVWTSCIMFFQVLLLAGYGLAHGLVSKLNLRQQCFSLLVLLLTSVGLMGATAVIWPTPVTPAISGAGLSFSDPSLAILRFLALAIGLPFLILSTTSPLLQSWFSKTLPSASPYRLYALSNAGSLLGLLSYPFFFEPLLRLQSQAWIWAAGYALYAAAYAGSALRTRNVQSPEAEKIADNAEVPEKSGPLSGPTLWIVLSFLASTLLLATTNYICQEVAVIPFLWVLPLSVYLLSFILTFQSASWYKRNLFHAVYGVAVVFVLFGIPVDTQVPYLLQISASVVLLFAGCVICHGEAYRLRPPSQHLTRFYLSISIGGALGGIFVNFVAPRLFPGYWEYPLGIVATSGLLLALMEKDQSSWLHQGKGWLAAAIGCGIVLLITMQLRQLWPGSEWLKSTSPRIIVLAMAVLALALYTKNRSTDRKQGGSPLVRYSAVVLFLLFISGFVIPIRDFYSGVISTSRNFYGVLTVELNKKDNYLTLWHGKTAHGFQFLRPDLERLPTGYYGEHSGVNILLRNWQGGPARVGLVGMGAGTLAAMGRPGDSYRFYEINPDVVKYCIGEKPVFTFLKNSQAGVEIVLGDARVSLDRELRSGKPQKFDVLVLDAFSSDAIPLHLLTREAFAIYLQHLRGPDSVIALHISNKTLDLGPVVAGIAQEFHLQTVRTHPTWMGGFSANSDWILLSATTTEISGAELKRASVPFPGDAKPILWTDEYSNLVRVLR
jgi:hypothetical protein